MKRRFDSWGFELNRPFVISGPCSVEREEQVMQTALQLKNYDVDVLRGGIWKPRTRPNSFEGMGTVALPWLKNAADAIGRPSAVEVANAKHVELCLENGIDMLWIGARTSVNPFAVQEIADALQSVNIPVLIKNPINPDFKLWLGAIERIEKAGVEKVGVIHRGFSVYGESVYRNKPIWTIPIELRQERPDLPIVCDPSHIAGRRDLLLEVAQQALDLGFDGLMVETHCNPDVALSDAKQQIVPDVFHQMTQDLRQRGLVASNDEINALREQLDDVDAELFRIVEQRMSIAKQIGAVKRRENLAIYQPEHLREIIQKRLNNVDDLSVSPEFITNLINELHTESLRQQTRVFYNK